jgi:hypothetical protein
MTADSPDLVVAKRLPGAAKQGGFHFQRVVRRAVVGVRETLKWRDTIYLAGFGQACTATRPRASSLIVPGEPLITKRFGPFCPFCVHCRI